MEWSIGHTRNKIHPQKLALWIACGSILMMFAAFSSAYIVRQAAGNWLEFKLPSVFFYNTVVILASSATLQLSYWAFKRNKALLYRLMLMATFVLGLCFVVLQYQGWVSLNDIGVALTGNPSGSFVYLISGVHAAHVLGGLAVLIVAITHALGLPYYFSKKRNNRFQLTLFYWHFVDFLWLYILFFLLS